MSEGKPAYSTRGRGVNLYQLWNADGDDMSWQARGSCRGLAYTSELDGSDLWFPPPGRGYDLATQAAKRICADCPVRVECLTHALDADERYGVWGGLTYQERRELRRDGAA